MRALRHAMKVAHEIHIVDMQPSADTPTLLLHAAHDEIDEAKRERGRSMLTDACKLLDEACRTCRAPVLIGELAVEIDRTARSERVNAIIMGARGMGALANLAFGSTVTTVATVATGRPQHHSPAAAAPMLRRRARR
jgi:nucleotide-binding universal stress UspA family protein